MMVIPAIDLKESRCVRLVQGRMDQETVYSEDPVRMARHWEAKGAERLHVVDLNGAVSGRPFHKSLIETITASIHIPVEVGGGIRDLETVESYLASGVQWVVLGTVALQDPHLVEEACNRFPQRVILAIDARGGKVAIQGWKETVLTDALALAKRFEGMALSAVIFTDIERDGMSTGVNLERTGAFARSTSIPVIASGGVSGREDIEDVAKLEPEGVVGVIVGRALYAGKVDLEEAIRITKSPSIPLFQRGT
jgi:phosphoribosylformimino-5-aminoimidazole carboxamide ribotide isomerase